MERGSTLTSKVVETDTLESIGDNQNQPLYNPDWSATFPYNRLRPEHIDEIVNKTIARCDAIVDSIINTRSHTHETVLEPINEIYDIFLLASGYLSQWLVNPDETVRATAQEGELQLWHYITDLYYNEDLYRKYTVFKGSYDAKHLSKDSKELAAMLETDFQYAGHKLSRVKRARLRELDHGLIDREIAFDHNLSNDKTTVELTELEISGAPHHFLESLQRDPQTGKYIITMDYATFFPFMRQVPSREGRRKVSRAFFSRAQQNAKILDEVVEMRQEMVELLGIKSWAHLELHNNMAKSISEIQHFYDELIEPLTIKAKEEVALMTGMLIKDGHRGPLRDYDIDYYEDQVIKLQYGIERAKIAEYFPLDSVMEGLFDITGKLFNIRYRQVDIPTWHPDVRAYAITDSDTNEEIGLFYMDLFPREGKFHHACTVSMIPGRELPNKAYRIPHAAIIANYTPPVSDRPSLLSQDERASYQYHEFGHILHHCLTEAKYVTMSGFNTEIDMSEVPSQAMEFWGWEPELIAKYSRHYKTGKPMPLAMARRLAASKNVNVALRTLERIRRGMFDLAVHMNQGTQTVRQIWHDISNEIGVVPPQPGTYFPATFGHIATSGYAASYHGYERSMPICADIFERFKNRGLTDPELGAEYRRKVLEIGYAQFGLDTIKDFLGKVDSQPYLRSLGLTAIAGR